MPRNPRESSPYFNAPTRVDSEGRVFYASPPVLPSFVIAGEKLHVVTTTDEMRPDLIAHATLDDPEMWWAIMAHNNVKDPFTLLGGDNLRIPLFTSRNKVEGIFADVDESLVVTDLAIPVPPPFVRMDSGVAAVGAESPNVLHLFNFDVPLCLVGRVHFEIQAAIDPDYRNILLRRISAIGLDRWHVFKPSSGYGAWPPSGLNGAALGHINANYYFAFIKGDPLVKGGTYYVRYRALIDNGDVLQYGTWISRAVLI